LNTLSASQRAHGKSRAALLRGSHARYNFSIPRAGVFRHWLTPPAHPPARRKPDCSVAAPSARRLLDDASRCTHDARRMRSLIARRSVRCIDRPPHSLHASRTSPGYFPGMAAFVDEFCRLPL
jgi:hypothetical protein